MRIVLLIFAIVASLVLGSAWAVDTTQFDDPQLQARYKNLTHELRCVKCQNQSLADSPSEVASELRREVKSMLLAGKSDDDVREFMVARYGDFILFKPRFAAHTAWLWFVPGVLLLIGLAAAIHIVRQRSALVTQDNEPVADDPLQEEPRQG